MKKFSISDGKLVLVLEEDEGDWYTVTSPTDPALITQAKNIREAFKMAYNALAALTVSRKDRQRWTLRNSVVIRLKFEPR